MTDIERVPNEFHPGDVAKSQEVNADFDFVMGKFPNKANVDLDNLSTAGEEAIKKFAVSPRNVGELVWSTVPQTDANLHLADGTLFTAGGVFDDFIRVMKAKYEDLASDSVATYNVGIAGSVINTNGILSSFGSNSYAKLPTDKIFTTTENDWELIMRAKTPASYGVEQYIIGSGVVTGEDFQGLAISIDTNGYTRLYLSSNGSSWNIANGEVGSSFLANGTFYYFKLVKDVNGYTLSVSSDSLTWEQQSLISSNNTLFQSSQPFCLGGNFNTSSNTGFWRGEIDLRNCYIDIAKKIWWDGVSFEIPCFTTEEDWQSSVETYGACGKYVYDKVSNTLRLPKISGFVEGTLNKDYIGELTQAGVPNIYGVFTTVTHGGVGGVCYIQANFGGDLFDRKNGGGWGHVMNVAFDASLASPIYGRSETVQPQSLKYYVYIIVGTSTKTEIQVDIDNIVTDLNRLSKAYITETYTNGTSGYIKYSNGYCEQWGQTPPISNSTISVSFPKPFINTNYNISAIAVYDVQVGYADKFVAVYSLSTSSVVFNNRYLSNNTALPIRWKASGYVI